MIKKIILGIVTLTLCQTALHAQFTINNPKEKFGFSVSMDGVRNSDYTWNRYLKTDGKMKNGMDVRVNSNISLVSTLIFSLSVSPFYTYSTTYLDTYWNGTPMFDFPKEHHHYGATVSGSMNMMLGSKPITFMATTASNFSQYGYENMSGVFGTMIHITRKPNTYFALGAIYLYGSPLAWSLYPLIIYRHTFNDKWNVSIMELNDYLYYNITPKVKVALGSELVSDLMYFRPEVDNLPKKSLYSLLSERVGFYANWQATEHVTLELSAGENIPIWGRIRESGHRKIYMKLYDEVKPYVQLKAKYSLLRKQTQSTPEKK